MSTCSISFLPARHGCVAKCDSLSFLESWTSSSPKVIFLKNHWVSVSLLQEIFSDVTSDPREHFGGGLGQKFKISFLTYFCPERSKALSNNQSLGGIEFSAKRRVRTHGGTTISSSLARALPSQRQPCIVCQVARERSHPASKGHGFVPIYEKGACCPSKARPTMLVFTKCMVQDSITAHIDTARENSSHLNFTYRMAISFAEIALSVFDMFSCNSRPYPPTFFEQ